MGKTGHESERRTRRVAYRFDDIALGRAESGRVHLRLDGAADDPWITAGPTHCFSRGGRLLYPVLDPVTAAELCTACLRCAEIDLDSAPRTEWIAPDSPAARLRLPPLPPADVDGVAAFWRPWQRTVYPDFTDASRPFPRCAGCGAGPGWLWWSRGTERFPTGTFTLDAFACPACRQPVTTLVQESLVGAGRYGTGDGGGR